MTNNENREAFEKWAGTHGYFDCGHWDYGKNRYVGMELRAAYHGYQARQPEIDALQKELHKATRTLELAGYTDEGGELWKPPLGNEEALRARIAHALMQEPSEAMVKAGCEEWDKTYHRTIAEALHEAFKAMRDQMLKEVK